MAFIKEMIFKISSVIENLLPSGLVDGTPERTEISPEGYYKTDGEETEITYSETSEGGKIVSVINVTPSSVRVVRRGAVESDMLFAEGTSHRSLYTVAPYSFDAEVRCRKIRRNLSSFGGRIDILYDMSIGGAEKRVRMRIDILPKEEK